MGSDDDKKFAQQFAEAGGFNLFKKYNLLYSEQKERNLVLRKLLKLSCLNFAIRNIDRSPQYIESACQAFKGLL